MSEPAYLDVEGFSLRTIMPSEDVDLLRDRYDGFLEAQLAAFSSEINARLRKRYAVPFKDPVPAIVLRWLVHLTTPEAYRKRGVNPHDPQIELVEKDRDRAIGEIKEAADCETGLFDLPLRDDADGTAVQKGGPFGYAEPTPYDWLDVQAEAVRGRI